MRIALGVEYDGSAYQGFQLQEGVPSIQGCLEEAVSSIAAAGIRLICAGRTDTGVHATGQVVHFDCPEGTTRPLHAWIRGVNTKLPPDIAVRWAREVPEDFHARFSAFERIYRYIIWNGPARCAVMSRGVSDYSGRPLDHEAMDQGAAFLLGERDFTSFRSSQCQSRSPFRNVHSARVIRRGDFVILEIAANAFLHHMVRNIAGSLLEVGLGRKEPDWIQELLEIRDRNQAGPTGLPGGLYLVHVSYPDRFGIPEVPLGPLWLE